MFKDVLDLLAHKQLSWDEGKISLFGQEGIMLPVVTLVEIQKLLEKTGNENILYYGAKASGIVWIKSMLKAYKMNTIEEQARWGAKAFTLSGNGRMELAQWNLKDLVMVHRVYDSAISKAYGKADHAVDHVFRGLFAGASTVFFNRDVDTVEVACLAKGNEYCEFLSMPRDKFDAKDKEIKRQLRPVELRTNVK